MPKPRFEGRRSAAAGATRPGLPWGAASLLGGLALAWREGDRYRAVRLEPHTGLRPVVIVPTERSATSVTRGLLPDRAPHADAAFSAARCALAVHAVTTRPELLLAATEDRLHQDYRKSAWPDTLRVALSSW